MKNDTLVTLGAIALAAYVTHRLAGQAANTVGAAVIPTSRDNLAARAVDGVGDVLDNGADDGSFKLGRWLYGVVNPDRAEALRRSGIGGL